VRDDIVKLVRQEFRRPGAALASAMVPDSQVHLPLQRRVGDRFVVEHDLTTFRIPLAAPRYVVDARLAVDCDAKAFDARGPVTASRGRALELVSGRPQGPPSRPPAGAGPPPEAGALPGVGAPPGAAAPPGR